MAKHYDKQFKLDAVFYVNLIYLVIDLAIRREVIVPREQIADKWRLRRFLFCKMMIGKRNLYGVRI